MSTDGNVTLAHGSGGKASHELIKKLVLKYFKSSELARLCDGAIIEPKSERLVMTTDSFVIKPLFFPGGDIGKLAVSGTVNDLAVMGAKPLYLSCGFVVEEGFLLGDLERIIRSMAEVAQAAGVEIVTGDLKVTEHGACDGIFVNTTGIGALTKERDMSSRSIEIGDHVLINGTIGDHALAVLSARQAFNFEAKIESDCAALFSLIDLVMQASRGVKFMRDPTRGGVATVLNEIVEGKNFGIQLEESSIPVRRDAKALCEILGFEPIYLANEGKVLIVADPKDSRLILDVMRSHPLGEKAAKIGEVVADSKGKVTLRSSAGGLRIADMLIGEPIPRIC
ncbi:MAG: hydrogenase expression/formation protein HypE [Candidatus Omnitrophica bacterium]|nr:hydrogenase expression/formation protein HypE [Candidatus Omnitrophota bacterium]